MQEEFASKYLKILEESGEYNRRIVTQIEPLVAYYPAEEYHHDYFARNPYHGYCMRVVKPKVDKFKKDLSEMLK